MTESRGICDESESGPVAAMNDPHGSGQNPCGVQMRADRKITADRRASKCR